MVKLFAKLNIILDPIYLKIAKKNAFVLKAPINPTEKSVPLENIFLI